MIDIIVSVCMTSEVSRCKDVSLSLADEHASIHRCAVGMQAQIEIGRWLETHPNWHVKRWTCVPASKRTAKI